MLDSNPHKAAQFMMDWQILSGVLLGMVLQFAMGDKRTAKVALLIALSSIFAAWFIVPALIEGVNLSVRHFHGAAEVIPPDGKIAKALYALSALISVELLAFTLRVLPIAIRVRTKRFLGVDHDPFQK